MQLVRLRRVAGGADHPDLDALLDAAPDALLHRRRVLELADELRRLAGRQVHQVFREPLQRLPL
jgi:predicted nucleotidyltransferase